MIVAESIGCYWIDGREDGIGGDLTFAGEVVGLGTGWISGPPVGDAGVSASAGASVHFHAVLGLEEDKG